MTTPSNYQETVGVPEKELVSMEEIKAATKGGKIAPQVVYTAINELVWGNDQMRNEYRNNVIGYMSILNDPDSRFKVKDYLNAVKYVSHKLGGVSNKEAYSRTFPDRVRRIYGEGGSDKDLNAYVAMYTKSKLVVKMLEQSLVPTYILNADLWQEALNVEATLMRTAKSEKVRSDSAAKILDILKPPEAAKLEIDIGIKQDSSVNELRAAARELAKAQRLALENGEVGARDLAEAKLIQGSVVDE